jgi:predicted NAD/FAD-binding protein
MRIAIIGSGISGLSAAWALRDVAEVTVYEKNTRIGGHSNTVDVDYDGTQIAVDTGFIVYNELNYPNMIALFAHLGVNTEMSDMSFAVTGGAGAEWSSNGLGGVFAWKRNWLSPTHWSMIADMAKFNAKAQADAVSRDLTGVTLREYCVEAGVGKSFMDRYLIPMGAAIWSTPGADMLDYPASSFVRFFNNHRLLHVKRPDWRTVSGGSRNYVSKFVEALGERIRVGCGAISVTRAGGGVMVRDTKGNTEHYDHVIMACHSSESVELLGDASPEEKELLGAVRYGANTAYLHRDSSLMPARKAAWASWNVQLGRPKEPVTLTYWMNRLQNIDHSKPLFVTLNPATLPDPAKTFAVIEYEHPLFDQAAAAAQRLLPSIQGANHVWFAGAWQGYGFHEDGLRSGLRVALRLGGSVPWNFVDDDIPRVEWAGAGIQTAQKAVLSA